MALEIFNEYKFKFYLNANHYIIIDGKEGEQHPHTWEFMVHIRMNGQKFAPEMYESYTVIFSAFQKASLLISLEFLISRFLLPSNG